MVKEQAITNFSIYEEIKIKSISDLHEISEKLSDSKWLFRGQESDNWQLTTKLERDINNLYKKHYPNQFYNEKYIEGKIISEFKKYAFCMLKDYKPDESNYIEWLSYIQHYGGSTRLLDFSWSLYVASYFAVKNLTMCDDACIWCLNIFGNKKTKTLNTKIYFNTLEEKAEINYEKNILIPPFEGYEIEVNDYINKAILPLSDIKNNYISGDNSHPDISIYQPQYMNERMRAQKGIFVLPMNLSYPYEKNLLTRFTQKAQTINEYKIEKNVEVVNYNFNNFNSKNCSIIKVIIPNKLKSKILSSLLKMNIDEKTLFPDLAGVARYSSSIIYSYDNEIGEINLKSTELKEQDYIESAKNNIVANKLDDAISILKKTIKNNPKNEILEVAYYYLGLAYEKKHKFDSANNYYEKAIKINKINPQIYYHLASNNFQLGNYTPCYKESDKEKFKDSNREKLNKNLNKAEKYIRVAKKQGLNNRKVLEILALINRRQKNYSKAERCYKQILKLAPEDSYIISHFAMSYCEIDNKQYDKAEKLLLNYIENYTNKKNIFVLLHVLFLQDKYDEAEKIIQESMKKNIENKDDLENALALIYKKWGKYEKALKIYKNSNKNHFSHIADIYVNQEENIKAIEYYKKSLEETSYNSSWRIYEKIADLYVKENLNDNAVEYYDIALFNLRESYSKYEFKNWLENENNIKEKLANI